MDGATSIELHCINFAIQMTAQICFSLLSGSCFAHRYGTCGGITVDTPAGCIVVASEGSGYICRNPDAFASNYASAEEGSGTSEEEPAYRLSKVAPADPTLSALVQKALGEQLGAEVVHTGVNVSAESFYSSQGRIDGDFDDLNTDINALLLNKYPNARSLEMETFWLLHLAKCCKVSIKATAAAIVLANRPTGKVMDGALLDDMERKGGLAMLQAITQIEL